MTDKIQGILQQPIVKIGHYTLGQTLGVGTFGKVKSDYLFLMNNYVTKFLPMQIYECQFFFFFNSWRAYANEA